MFCVNCGHRMAVGAKFCTNCGTPAAVVAAQPYPALDLPPELSSAPAAAPSPAPAPAAIVITAPGLYAGFWRRGVALWVDWLIIMFGFGLLLGIIESQRKLDPTEVQLVLLLVVAVYKVTLESSPMQATFGKRAVGIKVTDLAGDRISLWRALARFVVEPLSFITLYVGFLMAAFTRRRQALHDKIVGTLVVRRTATQADIARGGDVMPLNSIVMAVAGVFLCISFIGILAAISIPAYQDYLVRSKLTEVINDAQRYEAPAAQAILSYKGDERFIEYTPSSRYAKSIVVDRQGAALSVVINADELHSSDVKNGAYIQFDAGNNWSCRGVDIPAKFLPQFCRQ